MSTRSTWFEIETPSANFDVHTDVIVRWHGDDKATQDLLVYCSLNHDERGNGYGDGRLTGDGGCGVFYVDPDDFATFCRRYLEEYAKGRTR